MTPAAPGHRPGWCRVCVVALLPDIPLADAHRSGGYDGGGTGYEGVSAGELLQGGCCLAGELVCDVLGLGIWPEFRGLLALEGECAGGFTALTCNNGDQGQVLRTFSKCPGPELGRTWGAVV